MSKISRFIVIAIVVVLATQGLAINAFAGPPAGSWVTGIQIQNTSGVTAETTINFYWAAGTGHDADPIAHSLQLYIPPNQAATLYVPNITELPTNFVGSAVVSSNVPVSAILNTEKTASGVAADPKRQGTAIGVSDPSQTVYAPYLRKNYYNRNSYIAVQNTSSTTATVVINYTDASGSVLASAQDTAQLIPYQTKIFYQNDNAGLPNGFSGSAIITGTAPLATIVNIANSGATALDAGFESYNGFIGGTTKVYLPKLTVNYYGYQTGIQIQNTGNAAATMTITYKFGSSTIEKVSPLIQPGQAWMVFLANKAVSGLPDAVNGPGAAVVTSAQPMVAIVSERNDTNGFSVVTSGVAEGESTDTVLFPKFDTKYYNYNGGIQIQNLGITTTTLRATFSLGKWVTDHYEDLVLDSPAIGPGQSAYWFGPNVANLRSNFKGPVVVVSLAGEPIAGVYTGRNDSASGDSYTAYNGMPK